MTQFCWAEVSGSGLTGHEEPVPDVTVQSTVQIGQLGSLLQQAAQLDPVSYTHLTLPTTVPV